MNLSTQPELHAIARRPLSQALSSEAVHGLTATIAAIVDNLITKLERFAESGQVRATSLVSSSERSRKPHNDRGGVKRYVVRVHGSARCICYGNLRYRDKKSRRERIDRSRRRAWEARRFSAFAMVCSRSDNRRSGQLPQIRTECSPGGLRKIRNEQKIPETAVQSAKSRRCRRGIYAQRSPHMQATPQHHDIHGDRPVQIERQRFIV